MSLVSKARQLSQKAAQLKATLEQAPATVAQLRETVTATTSQLQQLRAEVQANVAGLRADTGGSVSAALQEINNDRLIYLEAGYEVSEIDLEVSPVERLLVHLYQLEETPVDDLTTLIADHRSRRTTHAILSALLQARQAAAKLSLPGMQNSEVIIGIGPVPSVRLCWHARDTDPVAVATPVSSTLPPPVPATNAAGGPSLSSFSSSYFERRVEQPRSAASAHLAGPAATSEEPAPAPVITHSSRELLAKYKSSPHFSKYRR